MQCEIQALNNIMNAYLISMYSNIEDLLLLKLLG